MRGRFGLILAILVALVLALVAIVLFRGVLGAARLAVRNAETAPDPMFAEPAAQVTRPPESFEDEKPVVSGDEDPSRDWVYETLTPVEQTAAELAAS